MNRVWRRIHVRALCLLLDTRCAISGHDYGTHFTDMFHGRVSIDEKPWCLRCGREQAK